MTAPRESKWFLILLVSLATGLLVLLVAPFAGAFFVAAVLAAVMWPLQMGLRKRLGDRRYMVASILVTAMVIVVLLPLTILGFLIVRQIEDAVEWTTLTAAERGTEGLVEPLPEMIRPVVRNVIEAVPHSILPRKAAESEPSRGDPAEAAERAQEDEKPKDTGAGTEGKAGDESAGGDPAAPLEKAGSSELGTVARVSFDVLKTLADLLVQVVVLVVTTFFLLSEGKRLVDYLIDIVPMAEERSRHLLHTLRQTTVAVFVSTIVTGALQTAVALVGYTIAGVGALPLLGFVTFLFSFVPAIGAAGVCALTGAYIWIAGETGLGIFLVVYGLVAVGLTDEVVKPLLARGDGQLPASIIFFAMLCGLAGFGVMGLVAGPLIVVLFKVVVETVRPSQIPGSADGTL